MKTYDIPPNEGVISPREQINDDLGHMILPSKLTIRLFSLEMLEAHLGQLQVYKDEEALKQKESDDAFIEILSLTGHPIHTRADQKGNFFDHLREKVKLIEHHSSKEKE